MYRQRLSLTVHRDQAVIMNQEPLMVPWFCFEHFHEYLGTAA